MKLIGGKPLWKKVNSPPPERFVPGKKSRKARYSTNSTTANIVTLKQKEQLMATRRFALFVCAIQILFIGCYGVATDK